MKCIQCGDEDIEIIEENGEEKYRCSKGHVNPRMVKNEGLEYYREDGDVIHRSVGALIVNDGELLLLKRRKYPYKYSIPAGHLEKDEDPDKAVGREVKEETGLETSPEDYKQVFRGQINDPCRRGCDVHDWNLYILELEERPETASNEEAERLEWVDLSEVDELELTAPTKKFIVKKKLLEE
ncbi:MAG: NUDIX hydrolase [Candidatus Nanohalobium sp.]